MHLPRIFPLLCLLLVVPALESQNSSAAPATAPPAAQSPSAPTTTMSVDVNVVNLPVTVRDKHGKIVTNLTKDDFALEEDGKPQTIRYFNQESNLPLTVGLLVDTSMSERDNLDKERAASRTFLDQMITRPTDRAFVIHFDRQVELLQDLTADHGKLEKAVGEIDTTSAVQNTPTSDQGAGGTRTRRGAGTLLYDAIFLACDELMKKQTGRKAIVVLTDGEDRGSQETLNSAIESAQRSETVVYTIYYGGHQDRGSILDHVGMGNDPDIPGRRISRRRSPPRRLGEQATRRQKDSPANRPADRGAILSGQQERQRERCLRRHRGGIAHPIHAGLHAAQGPEQRIPLHPSDDQGQGPVGADARGILLRAVMLPAGRGSPGTRNALVTIVP
jgi:VWFA-related protein